eukprot:CAMPEP_0184872912 /NCGR_PEP_ID=MMETSP0580-20130426/41553_1 /TAXON_ID=1118495 /ORGANISM="Dactyliosolen fragilissimus" /LENGTH=562 /DNA_ID=CAMNT_0027375765 /DNA_START=334 /DNA_END=2019 /DNA_ORIENTATION=+
MTSTSPTGTTSTVESCNVTGSWKEIWSYSSNNPNAASYHDLDDGNDMDKSMSIIKHPTSVSISGDGRTFVMASVIKNALLNQNKNHPNIPPPHSTSTSPNTAAPYTVKLHVYRRTSTSTTDDAMTNIDNHWIPVFQTSWLTTTNRMNGDHDHHDNGDNSNNTDSYCFGHVSTAISQDGTTIVIGIPSTNWMTKSSNGYVKSFTEYPGGKWHLNPNKSMHGDNNFDCFGYTVALSNNGKVLIVGAPQYTFYQSDLYNHLYNRNDNNNNNNNDNNNKIEENVPSMGYARIYIRNDDTGEWHKVANDVHAKSNAAFSGGSIDVVSKNIHTNTTTTTATFVLGYGYPRPHITNDAITTYQLHPTSNNDGKYEWTLRDFDHHHDNASTSTSTSTSNSHNYGIIEKNNPNDLTNFGAAVALSRDGHVLAIGETNSDSDSDSDSEPNSSLQSYLHIYEWVDKDRKGWTLRSQINIKDMGCDTNNVNIGQSIAMNSSGSILVYVGDNGIGILEWNGSKYQPRGNIIHPWNNQITTGTKISITFDGNFIALGKGVKDYTLNNEQRVSIYQW